MGCLFSKTDARELQMAPEKARKLHARVPSRMWCVSERDFDDFVRRVRRAHKSGKIKNDFDPVTGQQNELHDDPNYGPNMHAVNKYVIIPRTRRKGGMSWALMKNRRGHPISFFVTHAWKEGVYEFARKVKHQWPQGMFMWCCFLANPQSWDYPALKQLLGEREDLQDSPFMLALSATTLSRFVIVPNATESLYTRLWCVAELKKAMELELQRRFIYIAKDPLCEGARRNRVHSERIDSMVSRATCTDPADETRIRAYISGFEGELQNTISQLANIRNMEKMRLVDRADTYAYGAARESALISSDIENEMQESLDFKNEMLNL
eukprot:TRINITY_DN12452_c0_g1_i3.p1 TRINITY_DN12452_c0_g1~~TRINITY_DN12452_c0_g1_i3.p1  ORF type:complete len:323 (-),score=36.25 TRINITY_DN12452_c0_g1_i3:49-1017(-)